MIADTLGGMPILLLRAEDQKSFSVFERVIDGKALEFFLRPETSPLRLVDSEFGSKWKFSGRGVNGKITGKSLTKVRAFSDYWFDWKAYNPNTLVY